MNPHQKQAVLIIRIISVMLLIFSVMGLFDYVVLRLQRLPDDQVSGRLGAALTWTVGGIVVYALSKRLGRVVGQDLDEVGKPGLQSEDIV
jgi:hypothetical protein